MMKNVLDLPGHPDYELHGNYVLLNVTHDEEREDKVTVFNTRDTILVIPSPMWGFLYHLTLTCWHEHMPVNCGQLELNAQPEVSPACKAHSTFCSEEEQVVFLSPTYLSATYLQNSSVMIAWRDSSNGWRAQERMLKIEEKHWAGKTVVETKLSRGNSTIMVENLSVEKTYQLLFYPRGPNIPADIGQVAVSLALLRNNDKLLAFIAQVRLQAHVVWSGRIRVSWELAMARAETGIGVQELPAEEYKLVLRIGQGNERNLS
jgi:hypothetical protein